MSAAFIIFFFRVFSSQTLGMTEEPGLFSSDCLWTRGDTPLLSLKGTQEAPSCRFAPAIWEISTARSGRPAGTCTGMMKGSLCDFHVQVESSVGESLSDTSPCTLRLIDYSPGPDDSILQIATCNPTQIILRPQALHMFIISEFTDFDRRWLGQLACSGHS